ncbi:hypothetical protein [Alkalicoccobacillus plakortidis]|uniref:Uncharacterized protein n=1 Tax=Alkalicoccobacillus plakortidis TaxID=444060 RepID=A0ABT0XLX7_9BACI|nr:hypothetical protein [Alkalicoccobacillus plakortidis]MCM2676913.1 hypothetical protein [Alkalicoccobacillus plakortidis]
MARSKAQKQRKKLEREGRRNPENNRSPYAFADLTTRKTKTKKDLLYKQKTKNHLIPSGDDGSFLWRNSCFRMKFVS